MPTDGLTSYGVPLHFWVTQDATVAKSMYVANRDEWRLTSVAQNIGPKTETGCPSTASGPSSPT